MQLHSDYHMLKLVFLVCRVNNPNIIKYAIKNARLAE